MTSAHDRYRRDGWFVPIPVRTSTFTSLHPAHEALNVETALDRIGVTTNKQVVPDDPRPPLRPSGLRLGTPACTTRGMNDDDMRQIAQWIVRTLRRPDDAATVENTRGEVREMCRRYPVPGVG